MAIGIVPVCFAHHFAIGAKPGYIGKSGFIARLTGEKVFTRQ